MTTPQSRYELIETIGTGATSRVDKARDTLIGRTVALKTFLQGFGAGDLQKQFLREAQIIGRLAHPSIVSLYDVGIDAEGMPYFVMEYVEGNTLEKALEAGPLPMERAAIWATDLAAALSRAHRAKIIHGDVKPANILITQDGQLKLGDFGIARIATQVSSSGRVMGTPSYLSPEQILGNTQDTRSDLFSLGIILYQMATGVRPFSGSSVGAVCAQIITAEPPPPSHYNPALPREFDRVVMRCLEKDPKHRYATAEALGASLYSFSVSKPVPDPAPKTFSSMVEHWLMLSSRLAVSAAVALRTSTYRLAKNAVRARFSALNFSWLNRSLQYRDMWSVAPALVIAISLVPIAHAVRSYSSNKPAAISRATKPEMASFGTQALEASSVADRSVTKLIYPSALNDVDAPEITISASGHDTLTPPAVLPAPKPHVAHRKPRHSRVVKSVVDNLPFPEFSSLTIDAPFPLSPGAPITKQSSLNIDVMFEVADQTLAVFAEDELLLSTPLEAAHRGDTLRFNCPVSMGHHTLRVVLYRPDKTVYMQKEGSSEIRADAANTMAIHVNRRSKLLVKRETSLDVVWPTVPAPIAASGFISRTPGALGIR